jgi:hypothetical protein
LDYALLLGSVAGEVGHSRDHNNHSPSHHVVPIPCALALGAGFLSGRMYLAADDITQVAVVLTTPSATLLRWSDAAHGS